MAGVSSAPRKLQHPENITLHSCKIKMSPQREILAWSVLNPLETEDYKIRIHNCVSSPRSEDRTLVVLILYNFGRRELAFLFCAWPPGH